MRCDSDAELLTRIDPLGLGSLQERGHHRGVLVAAYVPRDPPSRVLYWSCEAIGHDWHKTRDEAEMCAKANYDALVEASRRLK